MVKTLEKKKEIIESVEFCIKNDLMIKEILFSLLLKLMQFNRSFNETGELQNIIPDPDNRYGAVEVYIDAVPIFRKASPKYGEQVLHLLLQGYNQVEIGKRLGISYEWVRKIMYKAKKLKGEKL